MIRFAWAVVLASLSLSMAEAELSKSGDAVLSFDSEGIHVSLNSDAAVKFGNPRPADLRLVSSDHDVPIELTGNYVSVEDKGGELWCSAELSSPSGSVFSITDIYSRGTVSQSFVLTRNVVVKRAGTETGFQSCFQLSSDADFEAHEYFIPGIWYRDNARAKPGSFGTRRTDDHFLIREDRMPLPLVMMRDSENGAALSLIHLKPDGSTCEADAKSGRVVDERIRVSSLGVEDRKNTGLIIRYPASEGAISYAKTGGGTSPDGKRWSERFHPIREGFTQQYSVLFNLRKTRDFQQSMKDSWRMAFGAIPHPYKNCDLGQIYDASIGLVSRLVKPVAGAPGVPFKLVLPQGTLESEERYNYQMGFVGQQLPLAYHLLRYGIVHNDPEDLRKGESMVDFWVKNSPTAEGLPRVWYDTFPEPGWRKYDSYLRIASDGMNGALMAWAKMKSSGRDKPEWLAFCKGFGDWLVKHQNDDGSWFRSYHWDGSVAHTGKSNSSNPVAFLIGLHLATGDQAYLKAAVRAGDYCLRHIDANSAYAGGAPDNPDVLDKEAGFMAIDAFLALWDATGERQYLEAAARAADFTETWAYAWNLPIPSDDPAVIFPHDLSPIGFSLIATGHSGADLFLAGAPFLFYRIYLGTGDSHYAEMARLFMHGPRNHVDVAGSLGYGLPGLCTEAINFSIDRGGRGRGVDVWLPWISYNIMEPLVQFEEAYGTMDVPVSNAELLGEIRLKDRAFGKSRGLGMRLGGILPK